VPDAAAPAAVPLGRAVAVGALAGALSGVFGVGGGILLVPGLVLVLGVDQRRASGTSLAAIVPIATFGVIGYALQGEIDLAAGALLALGAVVGAPVGAALLHRLPVDRVRLGFAALLVVTAARLFFPLPDPTERGALTVVVALELLALGVGSGLLAGLFGVGGGIILVPAQLLVLGIAPAVAKGTSLLVIIPTALSGTAQNLRRGNADLRLAAVLGTSGLVFSFAGSYLSTALDPDVANALFAVLLLASALRMIRQGRRS
jgi:hypothetical protein